MRGRAHPSGKEKLMKAPEWVARLFRAIDTSDAGSFAQFLAGDAVFTFGNQEPVRGRENVRNMVAGFFASIDGTRHDVAETWVQSESVIIRGAVTYTRKDRSTLTVPFANVLRMEGDLIKDYQIYVDTSRLYA
jgi:ketosteroid isomerase-like protein